MSGDESPGSTRLYVKLPTTIEKSGKTSLELEDLHPDIERVILPRKGLKSKFFFIVFASESKATGALKALKKDKTLYVHMYPSSKKSPKLQTVSKKQYRSSWTTK